MTTFRDDWETSEAYFDVPISKSVVMPEVEDVDMNGFSWSDEFGLMMGTRSSGGIASRLERSATTIDPSIGDADA